MDKTQNNNGPPGQNDRKNGQRCPRRQSAHHTSLDLDWTAKSRQNRWPVDDRSISAKRTATKDQQIERLQSALDQSQQLQALTENRYQSEHQQLAEIKGRSFLQRLKAVLVANP